MSDEEAREAALEQLKSDLDHPAEPLLSPAELEKALDKAKLASMWKAATVYVHGQTVQPTVGNGHRYRAIGGGTSGAMEPDWPKSKASIVGDGTSDPQLRWMEDGPAYESIYHGPTAAYYGWEKKSTKTVGMADLSGPIGDLKASQVHKHCLEMMAHFAPIGIS